jgi:hypothetical protein
VARADEEGAPLHPVNHQALTGMHAEVLTLLRRRRELGYVEMLRAATSASTEF